MTDMSAGNSTRANATQPAAEGSSENASQPAAIVDEATAKQQVVEAGKLLLEEQLVARTWGNVSCRVDGMHFAVSPSGLSYELTTPDDVAIYDMETGDYTGARKPSSEKGIHAAAYRQFPDAGFVIHTHQTYATALGLAGLDGLKLSDEEHAVLGNITVAGYGLPGTKKLLANVAAELTKGVEVVLMKQHGALLVGRNMDEAFARAKLLEAACKRACKGQPVAGKVVGANVDASAGAAVAAGTEAQEQAMPDKTKQLLSELKAQLAVNGAHIGVTAAPAVLEVAAGGHSVPAQLDDMAQMIGAKLAIAPADSSVIAKTLQKQVAVLVPGVGAICCAGNKGDQVALQLLVEKACIAHLHTHALGASANLSFIDTHLMHFIYKMKYSKKAQG